MLPKIGDTVEVEKKLRMVKEIVENIDGKPIVIWTSNKDIGGCLPSTWKEWKRGFDPHTRRGQIIGSGARVPGYEYYKLQVAAHIATRRAESQRLS